MAKTGSVVDTETKVTDTRRETQIRNTQALINKHFRQGAGTAVVYVGSVDTTLKLLIEHFRKTRDRFPEAKNPYPFLYIERYRYEEIEKQHSETGDRLFPAIFEWLRENETFEITDDQIVKVRQKVVADFQQEQVKRQALIDKLVGKRGDDKFEPGMLFSVYEEVVNSGVDGYTSDNLEMLKVAMERDPEKVLTRMIVDMNRLLSRGPGGALLNMFESMLSGLPIPGAMVSIGCDDPNCPICSSGPTSGRSILDVLRSRFGL